MPAVLAVASPITAARSSYLHHILLPVSGGLLEKPEACRALHCSGHTLALQSREVSVQATKSDAKSDAKSDTHLYLCTSVPAPHVLRLCMCFLKTDVRQGIGHLSF